MSAETHAPRSRAQLELTTELKKLLKAALAEDIGSGDITSQCTVPVRQRGRGELIAKAAGRLCGAPVANHVFSLAHKEIRLDWLHHDGEWVERGQVLARLHGPMRGLLAGERLALNFLQRLSGVATLTSAFHEAAGGAAGPLICDTRKTTPLWRALERYAVRAGGGTNHRFGLFDMVLIKENHARGAGGLRAAIRAAHAACALPPGRRHGHHKRIKIAAEARDLAEALICCEEKVDLILLDNFTPAHLRRVVPQLRPYHIPIEISGGVNLKNIAAFARAGADRISIGALTHSAPALDISLQLYPIE